MLHRYPFRMETLVRVGATRQARFSNHISLSDALRQRKDNRSKSNYIMSTIWLQVDMDLGQKATVGDVYTEDK